MNIVLSSILFSTSPKSSSFDVHLTLLGPRVHNVGLLEAHSILWVRDLKLSEAKVHAQVTEHGEREPGFALVGQNPSLGLIPRHHGCW